MEGGRGCGQGGRGEGDHLQRRASRSLSFARSSETSALRCWVSALFTSRYLSRSERRGRVGGEAGERWGRGGDLPPLGPHCAPKGAGSECTPVHEEEALEGQGVVDLLCLATLLVELEAGELQHQDRGQVREPGLWRVKVSDTALPFRAHPTSCCMAGL